MNNSSETTEHTPDHTRMGHTFHIPVMGTGFSIDTPLKVARYGVSSVISLVDDVLIEQVRRFYCKKESEPYEEIPNADDDARAKRITAYLNLVDKLVKQQVHDLQTSPFGKGSEITKYYEMLPDNSLLKEKYRNMLACQSEDDRMTMQAELRQLAKPGSIDVNIMTKLDRPMYHEGEKLSREFNGAMSALRGYASSTLRSAIVFSAGLNQHLYTYLTQFKDFFADTNNSLKKKIILKVTDYRSAVTQGKFLAKKGLWVSEYRVESGLNCGGHTFPSKGNLTGPIMDEFRKKKHELIEKLHDVYVKATGQHENDSGQPHEVKITVQGGIATAEENNLFLDHYKADSTGWGTPFLLAPDVTNIDDKHLEKLCNASEDDIYLSNSSPMCVPFWNLHTSSSEEARRERIAKGTPGSGCPKGYIAMDTEFTDTPICLASRAYQKKKLEQIAEADLSDDHRSDATDCVLHKSCICHDLSGSFTVKYGIDPEAKTAICSGPNIAYFSKLTSLHEMVDHIYGHISLMTRSDRPHVFVQELRIYIEHLRTEIDRVSRGVLDKTPKYFMEFKQNLLDGIAHYREIAGHLKDQKEQFLADLEVLVEQIESLVPANILEQQQVLA